MMLFVSLVGLLFGLVIRTSATNNTATVENYQQALEARLFPEWTRFWQSHSTTWLSQPGISGLQNVRYARLQNASNCSPLPTCLVSAYAISPSDQSTIAAALKASNASGALISAWPQYVNGTNHILRVYGDGDSPLYPEIDSISYTANSSEYELFLGTLNNFTATGHPPLPPPIDAFAFASSLLSANDRLEAIAYPDLWISPELNGPALRHSRHLDWDRYRYAAILIPGEGPEIYGVPLSPLGKLRSRIAASFFAKPNTAPFLIPSGGNVHPNLTTYTEALEMSKWLQSQLNVKVDNIAIEPYARHTTTNLRNGARVLQRLGAPKGKKVLIVTDRSQRDSIASRSFALRCQNELGYVTGDIGPTLGLFEVEWVPDYGKCAFVDPIDPLDP
ncbi:hypothetical protein M409DRAFT_55487 [Zasmidium cellare ATCC 36951]|uniref:DUF218 domain-containing protein n=1 Tax=Zasmidium cellare ATCC 36951 TaxID=1080233 RepID=A0A6A6CEP3_ZASCE|nr:uncharacterized protein M409DRAFT_55487 [Zasmidium cellare ATCC 36951]KAF2165585.1 hypothetical protein M409DRAFT_55487 [Zasmidium cellare ATCC 36951]